MKVMGIAADALRLLVEIDYGLLREQKAWLAREQAGYRVAKESFAVDSEGFDNCEGLLSLIDAIQDFAVDRMGKPEREVFNLEEE